MRRLLLAGAACLLLAAPAFAAEEAAALEPLFQPMPAESGAALSDFLGTSAGQALIAFDPFWADIRAGYASDPQAALAALGPVQEALGEAGASLPEALRAAESQSGQARADLLARLTLARLKAESLVDEKEGAIFGQDGDEDSRDTSGLGVAQWPQLRDELRPLSIYNPRAATNYRRAAAVAAHVQGLKLQDALAGLTAKKAKKLEDSWVSEVEGAALEDSPEDYAQLAERAEDGEEGQVPPNPAYAAVLYREAIRLADDPKNDEALGPALSRLGALYADGRGVEADRRHAFVLTAHAAELEDDDDLRARAERLRQALTADEQARAPKALAWDLKDLLGLKPVAASSRRAEPRLLRHLRAVDHAASEAASLFSWDHIFYLSAFGSGGLSWLGIGTSWFWLLPLVGLAIRFGADLYKRRVVRKAFSTPS